MCNAGAGVALPQNAGLSFYQGDGAAGAVGDVQVIQHVGVTLQEIIVVLQIFAHDLVVAQAVHAALDLPRANAVAAC